MVYKVKHSLSLQMKKDGLRLCAGKKNRAGIGLEKKKHVFQELNLSKSFSSQGSSIALFIPFIH